MLVRDVWLFSDHKNIKHSNLTITGSFCLTHWGRVTHICVIEISIIGSDNGLSPGRRQAIIWTNAGILLIGPLGTNFSENLIGIQTFSFKKMHSKMLSAKWRPFCLGLNVLIWNTHNIFGCDTEGWRQWLIFGIQYFLVQGLNMVEICQYHGYRYPGSLCRQAISSHAIDYVG